MNFLMFKAVTHVYGYLYIYKYEYTSLCSKAIDVKGLPVLSPITPYEYEFYFHDMYYTLSNMFQ